LENEIRVLMRQKTTFALAIADLDSFKQLNDTHGHEAGDRSLRIFAQLVRRVLRDVDLIGRWGGEEFVIVMPGTDAGAAVGVLERVRTRLVGDADGTHPAFTASFGVADSTLYVSKKSGRDRVTIADPIAVPGRSAAVSAARN